MNFLVSAIIGYVFGSIPFGLILTRLAGTQDLRTIGSGNIGATNVLRTGRKGLAAGTLALDMLKGTFAIILVSTVFHDPLFNLTAAVGAFFGHLFPVWLKFRGGKGVATFLGCLLGIYWPVAWIFALVWLLTAYFTRYSSLSALLASIIAALSLFAFGLSLQGAVFVLLAAILWWKHKDNIARLRAGTEGKIGQKS